MEVLKWFRSRLQTESKTSRRRRRASESMTIVHGISETAYRGRDEVKDTSLKDMTSSIRPTSGLASVLNRSSRQKNRVQDRVVTALDKVKRRCRSVSRSRLNDVTLSRDSRLDITLPIQSTSAKIDLEHSYEEIPDSAVWQIAPLKQTAPLRYQILPVKPAKSHKSSQVLKDEASVDELKFKSKRNRADKGQKACSSSRKERKQSTESIVACSRNMRDRSPSIDGLSSKSSCDACVKLTRDDKPSHQSPNKWNFPKKETSRKCRRSLARQEASTSTKLCIPGCSNEAECSGMVKQASRATEYLRRSIDATTTQTELQYFFGREPANRDPVSRTSSGSGISLDSGYSENRLSSQDSQGYLIPVQHHNQDISSQAADISSHGADCEDLSSISVDASEFFSWPRPEPSGCESPISRPAANISFTSVSTLCVSPGSILQAPVGSNLPTSFRPSNSGNFQRAPIGSNFPSSFRQSNRILLTSRMPSPPRSPRRFQSADLEEEGEAWLWSPSTGKITYREELSDTFPYDDEDNYDDEVMSMSMMEATIKVLQKQMDIQRKKAEQGRRRSCPVSRLL